MFEFLKSKFGKKSKEISKESSDERIDLLNSVAYGPSYDCVKQYNEVMARWLAMKNVPKFALDWLADSIKKGVNVEHLAVSFSVENGLPYLCDTEEETWLFESEENPLQDSTEGIYRVLLKYKYGSAPNENKINYWLNHLLSLANGGNMMAQGLICWKCGVIRSDGKYDGVIPQNLWKELKSKYEDGIVRSCKSGDLYAQLAVAKYNRDISDKEKEELYLSAIDKGLSDACYYYAKFLDQKRFVANGMTVDIPTYGTAEWQEYMYDELSLYEKGAILNKGVLAGYCQYRLGDMYAKGDGGKLKDPITAQMWFKKAYANGCKKAKIYIEE